MARKANLLAEIAADLTGSEGQILTAVVHSVTESKKRKRSEMVAAIDHQGVNIYNVRSSKLATSYAVSPQAAFTCPPCSIRQPKRGKVPSRRLTYCSIGSPKPRIVCYSETTGTESSPIGNIETTSVALERQTDPVVALDTIHFPLEGDHTIQHNKLIATHKDGTVSCYSHDLSAEEWSTQISSMENSPSGLEVKYARLTDIKTARKALLKGREDVLASLDDVENNRVGSLLIVMVRLVGSKGIKGPSVLSLQIFDINSLKLTDQVMSTSKNRNLKLIASVLIDEPSDQSLTSPVITIDLATGSLYQDLQENLIIHDLTGLNARLVYELDIGHRKMKSHLRLSPYLLALSNATDLSVVELPYCAVQAKCSLADLQPPTKVLASLPTTPELRLLAHYAPLDLVVAISGRKLLTFSLSTVLPHHSMTKKRKRDGLLINSIGCGASIDGSKRLNKSVSNHKIKSFGKYIVPSTAPNPWITAEAELDRYMAQDDVARFEQMAFPLLGFKTPDDDRVPLPMKPNTTLDQRGVEKMLCSMFSVDKFDKSESDTTNAIPGTLRIRFMPRRTFKLVCDRGLMTSAKIERSLKRSGVLPVGSKLATGSLIRAVAEPDSSLELLSILIDSPTPLMPEELVNALAIVTHDSNAAQPTEKLHLLTNGHAESENEKSQMQYTESDIKQIASSPPPIFPDNKFKRQILTATIKKLSRIPTSSITRGLKSELSSSQLRILVDTLRMEIAQHGWLSAYEEENNSDTYSTSHQGDHNHQISNIAHLLNCIIDSIGSAGWILGTSVTENDLAESADTISYMRAEISAALEGIQEAAYLKGMLGEMLLCANNLRNLSERPSNAPGNQLLNAQARPLTVALKESSSVLPLGLKPPPVVSITKVAAGGELQKRSKRDIGRQKSRMVGKYSRERIVI